MAPAWHSSYAKPRAMYPIAQASYTFGRDGIVVAGLDPDEHDRLRERYGIELVGRPRASGR